MEKYFLYIWLAVVLWIVSNFYFRGKAAIESLGLIDDSSIIFFEKSASGYSNKSWKTRHGGATNALHIIITDKELIIKTYLFLAYVAKTYDLLHRIPLKNINSTELKKSTFNSKLYIVFTTKEGVEKEIVIKSKNNVRIKKILDSYIK